MTLESRAAPAWTRSGDPPFFEDLEIGDLIETAPSVTLTAGHAAVHQAIVGDRLRLALDAELASRVLQSDAPLAHPALVWDTAIGQSTLVTQRVIANLFYRGLVFRRAPVIGDTLRTTTEVVAVRQTTPRDGRAARGLAVLRVVTVDQEDRPVLDFWRCAMLPLRDWDGQTERGDDFAAFSDALDTKALARVSSGWQLDEFRAALQGPHFSELHPGTTWSVAGGDVVSCAPELARLSLNLAMAHHDRYRNPDDRRLVYGGHTIGLAAAQATRLLPNLVTIVAWHACEHTAAVFEGDTLSSQLALERCDPLPNGGGLVHLRSIVVAQRADQERDEHVLDWRFVGVMA